MPITIKIIGIQLIPELNILEPQYDADNVTVTVEWAQQEPGVVYSVKVSPFVSTGNFTEITCTRYQLTIPYNKMYNFSVMATTPCRPNTTAFKFITLNYGEVYYNTGFTLHSDLLYETYQLFIAKCEHPRELLSAESNVSVSTIVGYNGFLIEGSTVGFSCPPGLEQIGSHSAKCTENGEWEPDLSQLSCNSEGYHTLSYLCFFLYYFSLLNSASRTNSS